jgi:hypothetical protein
MISQGGQEIGRMDTEGMAIIPKRKYLLIS